MEGFSIFLFAVGVFHRSVIGESSLQDNQEAKHSPALFLTLKLMDDMHDLKKEVLELKSGISDSKISNNELKDTINLLEGKLNSYVRHRQDGKESGATYVRWGRTQCPSGIGTDKIYDGFAAGDYYKHAGGGVELLCLPKQPSWGNYSSSHIGHAYVYGTEFEIFGTNSDLLFGKQVGEQNVPCVVCQSAGRLVALRIPGRASCYSGWTEEYRGYLFAAHHNYAKSSDYTCVDSDPEFVQGKHKNQNGRLLYPVEAACGDDSLPCPPYQDGWELACVICTK